MKILLIHRREQSYDSKTVREQPSGGTEKCFVFLSEAFEKLGHHVELATTSEMLTTGVVTPDVVITQEAELFEHFPSSRKVWWSHHFSDQPITVKQSPYARVYADHIVSLSQCHSDDLRVNLKLDNTIIGHGVWQSEIQKAEKDPYRLIYASAPFRGLERVPELFKAIKEKEPRATIAICSSMAMYGTPEEDAKFTALFEELSSIPGVELKPALNQTQLYAEYARASIFFYPCIWKETYCLALDEAIAHGCKTIVPDIGALIERTRNVPDRRVWVPCVLGAFGTPGFADNWGLKDEKCKPKDWLDVAKEWEAIL